MRGYLYIWNDPVSRCIIASGIEFRDIAEAAGRNGGILLLEHGLRDVARCLQYDPVTHLAYVSRERIHDLANEDIYGWGDFVWADYAGCELPSIQDDVAAQLRSFADTSEPQAGISLPGLGNRYLCHAHDDGWLLRIFYSEWDDIEALIGPLCQPLSLDAVRPGASAFWVSGASVEIEERTSDPDIILNRR